MPDQPVFGSNGRDLRLAGVRDRLALVLDVCRASTKLEGDILAGVVKVLQDALKEIEEVEDDKS